jgi:hypothetical protein
MPKIRTLTKCWADLGVKPTNVVWSWTACDEDKKIVAMTFWTNEFDDETRRVYESRPGTKTAKPRRGSVERLKHLQFAKDHCEGKVSVVLITARHQLISTANKAVDRWVIADREVVPWRMKVVELDHSTGHFKMVRVEES